MIHKLCLGTGMDADEPLKEQIKAIADVGFDCVFTDWSNKTDVESLVNEAAKCGIEYHSLHAPFYGMDDIWHDESGELAKKMMDDIFACTDDCKNNNIPLMICHTIIGMDNHSPNELGIKRISKLVEYAAKNGIKVAFENTEGEEYLEAVLDNFGDCENVGFCFDSGHEMCYNYGHDMLKKYGKHILSTHLNDNLGMTDVNNMTFLDDSHLLPFDGVADWNGIAERLHKCGYDGTLTFEIVSKNKPGRHANDKYEAMTFEEYIGAAYKKAVDFRNLFEKNS